MAQRLPDKIQSIQSEFKLYLRDAVLHSIPFEEIQKHISKSTNDAMNLSSSQEMKAAVASSFPAYASRLYLMYQRIFGGYTPKQLQAIAELINGQKLSPDLSKELYIKTPSYIRTASPQAAQGTQTIQLGKLPDTAYNRATPLYTYYKTVHAEVVKQLNKIALMEPKPDYASNVNLRNIAEMTVRFENQIKMLDELKANGTRLVWIEPHANCSERCEKWQGKLYSLDKTSGTIDGHPFEPLDNAMNVFVKTKSGKTYRNGCITGYNCRHKLTPYQKGNKPIEIPAEVVKRQRALEERQRAYERAIRYQRERTELFNGVDNSISKVARKRAAELNHEYKAYCEKNRIPYMEDRLKVIGG